MPAIEGILQDISFGLRLMRKSAGFTSLAVLSLALGIGASSAIFSLLYAVLVDPYPYKNADRIIAPTFIAKGGERSRIWYTVPAFLELRRDSRTLEDEFLADNRTFVSTRGLSDTVKGIAFSSNGFEFMGVPALQGRTFGPGDVPHPQTPPNVAVLSYRFWQRHFNGDPHAVGQTLELSHQPYTVIGVMPPRFTWSDADVYVPLALLPSARLIPLMARIKPGVSLPAVNAELQAMTEQFSRQTPNLYPSEFHIGVQRLNNWLLGRFRGTLVILMAAVACLLLIACGNVSILLLARASARQREIAVRSSMGASRGRILRQLLTEAVLLSLAGGCLGVLLAYRSVPAIVALMPEYSVPHEASIHVNGAVVFFTFGVSVLTGILFGMAPALHLAKTGGREAIQESTRSSSGGVRAANIRGLLIVAEVALTTVLLVGASVAIRGFIALTHARLGYDPAHVLTFYLGAHEGEYKTWPARDAHYRRVLEQLAGAPGVTGAAATLTAVPPWIGWDARVDFVGRAKDRSQHALVGLISGEYFSVLRIPLLRGRFFSPAEMQRTAHIAVVNQEFVHQFWPDGRDPVGQKIRVPELGGVANPDMLIPPGADDWMEIVGVVAGSRNRGLRDDPKAAVYLPYSLLLPPGCQFLLRTTDDPHLLAATVRERMRQVDPDQPVTQVLTLEEWLVRSDQVYPRFSTVLFTIFALLGLVLGGCGIFSVVSFLVARRTQEFGIRMALGARPSQVLGLVLDATTRLVLAGLTIGVLSSLALGHVIASYVEGWDPRDPVAFLGVGAVLVLVAFFACWLPARRATAIQPMSALRHD